MHLPRPRGPLTEALSARLGGDPGPLPTVPPAANAPVEDDDLQLALWMLYELHYRGFDEVDDEEEWDPALIALRRELEAQHEAGLRAMAGSHADGDVAAQDVPQRLAEIIRDDDGPSLSSYLQRRATLTQFREFVVHRSAYHLKEADPHAWGIPRLTGAAKAALVEIEYDEYGSGRPEGMHSALFAALMRGIGLDPHYGHYFDQLPGATLAVSNTISLFGLHRSRRGALAGHLAAFEMTSSLPNRAYSNGLQRLGFDAATARFFDEHVEADAVHEQIAAHDLCGSLARQEPHLIADLLFGARAALAVDRRFAEHVLGCWASGDSSLRTTAPPALLPA